MNKLFLFDKNAKVEYEKELQLAFQQLSADKNLLKIGFDELSIDYIFKHNIEVVISNGLPKEWFYILKGLKIVSIVIDDINRYNHLADIVIDFLSSDNNKYFTGAQCSFENHKINVVEIFNLIEILGWDSQFFGYNTAYLSCRYLSESIFYQISQYCKRNEVRLVEYLCNCHDNKSVLEAEKNGFHFTDIRLTFSKELPQTFPEIDMSGLSFKKADKSNIDELKRLTQGMYKDSRYFYDGNFELGKINEFYSGWVEKAVLGSFDDECYCLFDVNAPIGFCTIKYRDEQTASIGLFGVSPSYAGKGLGAKLLLSVLMKIKDRVSTVTVVTQGRNYAAQRLYQSVGFKTDSIQLWYHKWLD